MFVLVYVDDIVITSSAPGIIDKLIQELQSDFAIKDLGPPHFFLGVELTWQGETLYLSQQRYIIDLLKRTNMSLTKPITSPMSSTSVLSKEIGHKVEDPFLYRSKVGSLQYISLTRPDLAFFVNKVSQFMQEPCEPHWAAVKRILGYLKFSFNQGLCIRKSPSRQRVACLDSDWAGCPDDRRSTSGYSVFLGPNLLSWSSKKQPTVSRSSTEAEYIAQANVAAELVWIQSLLKELGIFLPKAPILHCDNIGATYLISNPTFHARTKHIAIDYHFVRDQVAIKTLDVRFLSNKDQLVDVLTKPLVSHQFSFLKANLNVCTSLSRLKGRIEPPQDNSNSKQDKDNSKPTNPG